MSQKLNDGMHHIVGEAYGDDETSPTLFVWVKNGRIESVSIHTNGHHALNTQITTPQNVNTKKTTRQHTVQYREEIGGHVDTLKVVELTYEEVA